MTARTRSTKPETSGFTLVGLLAVLAIISLLAGVLASALAQARQKSVLIKCATHLRQLAVAAQIYAKGDARSQFPDLSGGVWPWDLHARAAHGLLQSGATREMFYCPGFPEQNNDTLWLFTARDSVTNGYRVVGYSLAFKGSGRVAPTNLTESLTPAAYRIGGNEIQPKPSERVLIADATLSAGSNEVDRRQNRYTNVSGGWMSHRSAHLNGRIPAGGNLVFLDGHTEWKPFERMRVRTVGDPSFWW